MIRKIIHIDEEKCNGCGLCATACHEGAIDIINGKAKLVRENFCDGFGDCLPGCPTGAITFEEREAPAYDEAAVQENKKKKELQEKMKHLHEGGCPGSRMRMLEQTEAAESVASAPMQSVSRLCNWPVQIKLAPVHAPYFEGAKLLIAADCTAYAYANFHQEFMRGKVTLLIYFRVKFIYRLITELLGFWSAFTILGMNYVKAFYLVIIICLSRSVGECINILIFKMTGKRFADHKGAFLLLHL